MITPEEVEICYIALLGRNPEDEQVVIDKTVFADVASLIYDMATSAEFLEKNSAAIADYFGHNAHENEQKLTVDLADDTSKYFECIYGK